MGKHKKSDADSSFDNEKHLELLTIWLVWAYDSLLMYYTTLMTTAHSEFLTRISFLDYIYRNF